MDRVATMEEAMAAGEAVLERNHKAFCDLAFYD